MSGGGSGSSTTTVQKSDPWAGQQPYLLDLFARAQQNLGSSKPQYYPSSTVAPQSAATQQGQQMALGAAGQMPSLLQSGVDLSQYQMGAARDVGNNPYLQSAINSAMNPVIQRFSEAGGPLAQIRQNAIANTSEGTSTRQGIAEGIATRGLTQQLTDMASRMSYDAYNAESNRALQTLALQPQLLQSLTMPASVVSGVGGQQDAYTQALLNDAVQRWNFEQNIDSQKLAEYAKLIGGTGYGGTSETTAPGPTSNPLLGAVGGGMLGYGAMSALGSSMMLPLMATPYGMAAGALLGYLGSR